MNQSINPSTFILIVLASRSDDFPGVLERSDNERITSQPRTSDIHEVYFTPGDDVAPNTRGEFAYFVIKHKQVFYFGTGCPFGDKDALV